MIYVLTIEFYCENYNKALKSKNILLLTMNKLLKTKSRYSFALILGLVFLFLVSPCKVRNFIQIQLGAQQTKVLNKSKTTVSTESCVTFDVAQSNYSPSISVTKTLDFFVNDKFFALHLLEHTKANHSYSISDLKLIPSIPLYILYQNIRVYS